MPVPYNLVYFPVLLQGLIAMTIAGALILISFLLGKKVKNRVKDMPYECGITPTGSARERFSVRFYLVGMLFIVFDIESVFLFPWVVVYRDFKIFIVLVFAGFFYIWKKGALDWSGEDTTLEKRAARRAR
jgi:NADH-quinone oxidoreductase subunit A